MSKPQLLIKYVKLLSLSNNKVSLIKKHYFERNGHQQQSAMLIYMQVSFLARLRKVSLKFVIKNNSSIK